MVDLIAGVVGAEPVRRDRAAAVDALEKLFRREFVAEQFVVADGPTENAGREVPAPVLLGVAVLNSIGQLSRRSSALLPTSRASSIWTLSIGPYSRATARICLIASPNARRVTGLLICSSEFNRWPCRMIVADARAGIRIDQTLAQARD